MFSKKKQITVQVWAPARAAIFQERNFSPSAQPDPLLSVFLFFRKGLIANQIWAPARTAIFHERNISLTAQSIPLVSVYIFLTENLIANQIWTPERASIFQERNVSPIPRPNAHIIFPISFSETTHCSSNLAACTCRIFSGA